MEPAPQTTSLPDLVAEWPFPTAAALGSAVRAGGIEREIKARLPFPDRKRLRIEADRLCLNMPAGETDRLANAARIVSEVLEGIDALPVLPREVDDILTIAPRERLKWTKDGRLKSAGTRTVKLRGRARTVTFHVFDPRHVEDVLDRDLPTIWREEDVEAAAEARRRAARKAAATRSGERSPGPPRAERRQRRVKAALAGWDQFDAEGLLR